VARKGYAADKQWARLSRFFFEDRVEPVTPAELAAAASHGEHDALPGGHDGEHEVLAAGSSDKAH
jgi:ubiquinol-cytochrome c reductase cytochrome b subunit